MQDIIMKKLLKSSRFSPHLTDRPFALTGHVRSFFYGNESYMILPSKMISGSYL